MPAIPTAGITPQKKLFHNELIDVYPTQLPLEKIHFWPENNRTIFTFERLEKIKKKKLNQLSVEEITKFVAEQDIHKLQILTNSIERNGVQVPLIVRSDGKLLDGNRRYFACQWLKIQYAEKKKKSPEAIENINVMIIRKEDLTPTLELKILAEANFIPDLKVAWPLDAQARAVHDYYENFRKEKKVDRETAIAEISNVFGISRQRAIDLLDSLQLTIDFIKAGNSDDDRIRRREIVEDRFVYFWEFLNKAMKGRGAFADQTQLDDVRSTFFNFMAKGKDTPIKNVKQVEPLIQAKRDKVAWNMLKDSKGAKLEAVVAMVNEKKAVRKAEDKIRLFLSWLSDLSVNDITKATKMLLKELADIATAKFKAAP